MAQPVNGGSKNQAEEPPKVSQPPKEMSMEVRLLLAFVLMGAVMFVWQFIYKPEPPPHIPGKNPTSAAPSNPAANTSATANARARPHSSPSRQLKASAPTSPARNAASRFHRRYRPLRITSNQGATVRSWILKKYHGTTRSLDLMNPSAPDFFPSRSISRPEAWFRCQLASTSRPAIPTHWASQSLTSPTVRKVFRFKEQLPLHGILRSCRGCQTIPRRSSGAAAGDLTVPGAAANQRTLYFDVTQNNWWNRPRDCARAGPVTPAETSSLPPGGYLLCRRFVAEQSLEW